MILIMPVHAPPSLAELWPSALDAMATRRSTDAGTVLFRAGDPARQVFGVVRGRVTLSRVGPAGEDIVIHTAQAGELFAEASLHSERYHCTALSTLPSEITAVDAEALRARLQADPAFAMQWLGLLAIQLRRTRARVERLCLRSAADRVRHLLLTEGLGPDHAYTPRGSLKELAAELGLTHEALYRTLAALTRSGGLQRDGGTLRLPG